ncbi:ComF family protein [Uliginosibacterium sediminicola]|uniref:Double zinc ribbon domain-containing protein n=1 Tax=Uliginosibacterium sediminicola TaxID=2024550 RepID=A0ABU9Z323_9RHOO
MSNRVSVPFAQILWRPLLAGLARSWPHSCFVCGARCSPFAVCSACADRLPLAPTQACPQCALPSPDGALCGRCLQRPPHFDATRAAFLYETPLREMVLALKAGHGFALLDYFHEILLCAAEGIEADCVLPMPLHTRRLAERGFNQSLELARGVARVLQRPLRYRAVLRDIDTPHLAGLRQRARRRAVRGAFRCCEDFSGQRVLVIDDVMTSGATLDELARTLKLAGAAAVSNLVLARTLPLRRQ